MKCCYAGVMESPIKALYNGFGRAMLNVFDEYVEIPMRSVNEGLQGLKTGQVDLVFLQPQDGSINSQTLQHLKNIGAFVINWSGDVRAIIPPCYFEYAKYVDLTCFSNMNDVKILKSLGYNANFLQIGADEMIYHPDTNITKDVDIVFCGNTFGHFPLSRMRVDMVRELKRVYGDRFKAFGSGQPDGSLNNQKDEADMYRRAKIGINLSHFDYERYTSDRMFRMLLSGVCVLSHNYKEIEIDFKNGWELCTWNNLDNLKEAINQLLIHDFDRLTIADNGHQLALNNYTFKHMAFAIKELYEKEKYRH